MAEQLPDLSFLGNFNQMAIMHHEVFLAYKEAGFTRNEALQIVMGMINTTIQTGAIIEASKDNDDTTS